MKHNKIFWLTNRYNSYSKNGGDRVLISFFNLENVTVHEKNVVWVVDPWLRRANY